MDGVGVPGQASKGRDVRLAEGPVQCVFVSAATLVFGARSGKHEPKRTCTKGDLLPCCKRPTAVLCMLAFEHDLGESSYPERPKAGSTQVLQRRSRCSADGLRTDVTACIRAHTSYSTRPCSWLHKVNCACENNTIVFKRDGYRDCTPDSFFTCCCRSLAPRPACLTWTVLFSQCPR